jgi:hypothetical protein
MGLDDDIALRPAGAGEYEASIVEHWWTPRGPLGGYVMAIVHRGMELAVNDSGREPRSLNVYFLRTPGRSPCGRWWSESAAHSRRSARGWNRTGS